MRAGRSQGGHCRLGRAPAVHLFRERSPAVADDGPCDGLEEGAVFLGYLVGGPDEDAAGSIPQVSVGARGDESHDLVVQRLPVAGMVFVPDHQVDGQSLEPPIRVGLDKLARQLDVRLIFNAKKHDRKVAGDGITPEARLAPEVLQQEAGAGAKR